MMSCGPKGQHLIISLDSQNRCYLSVKDQTAQTAVIKAVAQSHGVRFTPAESDKLQRLPFLSQNIYRLPAWLSASAAERCYFPKGIPAAQLREYLTIGRQAAIAQTRKPLLIALRADEKLPAKHIMNMIDVIVASGYHRFNLVTSYQETQHRH